jgi:hypothetical protein
MTIPPGAIDTFRASNRQNMPHVARVLTRVTSDLPGAKVGNAWPNPKDVRETLQCRVSIPGSTPQERLIADGFETAPEYLVVFDAGVSVATDQRLYIEGATRGRVWTLYLDVVGSPPERSLAVQSKYLCNPVPRGEA